MKGGGGEEYGEAEAGRLRESHGGDEETPRVDNLGVEQQRGVWAWGQDG